MSHTIGMISLGCAKNQVNAEHMLWLLRQAGYEISPDPDGAELVIVNTCGFIESAKTEAIDNILAMAQYVAARGVDLWVRHVLVPGLTDDADGLRQLDAFIKTLPTVRRVEILPYHTLGLFKWQNLGIPYPLDGVRVPTAEEVETAEQLLHVRDYPDAPKGSTTK